MWQKYREHFSEILLGLLFSIILIAALVTPTNPVESLLDHVEMALYDLRLKLGENALSTPLDAPPIVVVDIDELSQKQEGRWPWPRNHVADLINSINEKEPALIILDSLFGSTEPLHPHQVGGCTDNYCPIASSATPADQALAFSMQQSKKVVTGFLFHQGQFVTGKLPKSTKPVDEDIYQIQEPSGYSTSIPIVQQASQAEGYINAKLDDDGILRRTPLFQQYDDYLYPSLSLAAAQRYLLENDWQARTAQQAGKHFYTGIVLGNNFIPTDPVGNLLIPYVAGKPPFTVISATDAMRNPQTRNTIEGAIVLVGSSGLVQGDLESTPTQANMPGVMIHAYALLGLLHPEVLLSEPIWKQDIEVFSVVVLSLLLLAFYPLTSPRTLLITGILLALTSIGLNVWLWHIMRVRIDLLPNLLLIAFFTSLFTIYKLLRENHTRNHLQHLFGQYIPPERIQQILASPQAISFAGEKREMSVLFADLHDFTSIAERLDTQTLKNLLNRYLNAATEIIFHHNGTVDKYIGDMVVAFWNAPLHDPQHAQQAVLCALGLRQMLQDKAADFQQFGIPPLQLGIGINTGEMNVGDMGSDHRRAYTVLGDAVNLASRTEALTRYYGVDILVSEYTQAQCPDIAFRTVDRVFVKGKQTSVGLAYPVGLRSTLSAAQLQQLQRHEHALQCYWQQDWANAAKGFAYCLIHAPTDPLAKLFLQRIAELSRNPLPKDWDGVYAHTHK